MRLFYGATAEVTDTFRALENEENMKTLLAMAVILSAVLKLLLLPIKWVSMTFLSPEAADATMLAFRYGAASTMSFLLTGCASSLAVAGSKHLLRGARHARPRIRLKGAVAG
ncbi:hypothetical protein PI125_g13316 [Phytophthora idaei]|nr:hypothetical protein PI125_g13316 [Phytophthora idaei]